LAGFQKTDFGVSSAEGAGNTKIGFIELKAAYNHYRDRDHTKIMMLQWLESYCLI